MTTSQRPGEKELIPHKQETTMRNYLHVAGLMMAAVALPAVLRAQTDSGPSSGSKVEPLKVAAVTGDDAGQELDFAAKRGNKPTLFVFIQADKWDRPVARFLVTLDRELNKDRPDVAVIAVWLTDDVEKSKEYLPRAQQSMNLSQTALAVYPGDKNGPPGWSINPGAHLTAVVADEGRVAASFAFRSLNETNVPAVLEKVKPK
jgi:hypothetical protein